MEPPRGKPSWRRPESSGISTRGFDNQCAAPGNNSGFFSKKGGGKGKAGLGLTGEAKDEYLRAQMDLRMDTHFRREWMFGPSDGEESTESEGDEVADSTKKRLGVKKKKSSEKKSKKKRKKRKKRGTSADSSSSEGKEASSESESPSKKVLQNDDSFENSTWVENRVVTMAEAVEARRYLEKGDKVVEKDLDSSSDEENPGPIPHDLGAITQHRGLQSFSGRSNPYGHALLPGEGAAMAQFASAGQRIPRRGEVGISQNEIGKLETLGYVMSGNRHAAMNAVRLRKENQILTAEEERQAAVFKDEERQKKEIETIQELQDLLAKRQEAIKEEKEVFEKIKGRET